MKDIYILLIISILLLTGKESFGQNSQSNVESSFTNSGRYSELPESQRNTSVPGTARKVHTTAGDFLISPNFRPFPQSTTSQLGVVASTMGGDQNKVFAVWNSVDPSFYGTGYCLSSNGGLNWSGNYQMIVAGNNGYPGSWVWPAGSSYAGRLGISVDGSSGISATYSTDNGASWNPFANVGGATSDRSLACVDDVPGSPYFGRAYTVWTDFSGTYINRIVGAYTSNGGASWTGYQPVSPVPPSGHYMLGCDIAVGPGGVVYCVWATCINNGQNATEDYLGFAKSTDGGVTWPVSNYNVVDINGIRAPYVFSNIQVNGWPRIAVDHSGGTRNGWIYALLSEKFIAPARDLADITLCRSTDGGTSWTHTLVNSDSAGRANFMASVCVDQTSGNLASGYYDMRNTSGTVEQYYVSVSNNGGNSWTDIQASDHDFTLAGYWWQSGWFGDHEGIVYSNGKVWPFWMDNSQGKYNVWTCAVTPATFSHDCYAGPFLSLPSMLLVNTITNIKSRIANNGTSDETAVPVKFFVDGVLISTTYKNLLAGQFDSVSNAWQAPSVPGAHQFMYVTSLATDQDRTNDTIKVTEYVVNSFPELCPFTCNPPIVYVPISGTPGPSGDNAGMTAPIGFTFNYVGGSYTQVWICTNGFIKMGPTGSTSPNNSLCTTDTGLTNIIAGFWDDLNTNRGGNIQYTTMGTAPNRKFIVQFDHVGFNIDTGSTTFQIILYETYNAIDIIYGQSGNVGAATGSVGLNAAPGGPPNIQSVIPAIQCNFTQVWTTECADLLQQNIPEQTFYRWCTGPFVGVNNNGIELPGVYTLSQNYPNPFNPVTVISFGIPKAGYVKLVVYDLLGKIVLKLVDEYKKAGSYKVDFDGSNLSSGIYFYKLEAGDFTANKKMLLVK